MKPSPSRIRYACWVLVVAVLPMLASCTSPDAAEQPVIALSPSNQIGFSVSADATDVESQTLEIRNGGAGTLNWSASADAAWINLDTTSGTLSAGEVAHVGVSVDASGFTQGTHSAKLTVSAPSAHNDPVHVLVIAEVVGEGEEAEPSPAPTEEEEDPESEEGEEAEYQVSVDISPTAATAEPGGEADYDVNVENGGSVEDSYELTVSATTDWPVALSSSTVSVAPSAQETVTLTVEVPSTAEGGEANTIVVKAVSVTRGSVQDQDSCTLRVGGEEDEDQVEPGEGPVAQVNPASVTLATGESTTLEVVVDSRDREVVAAEVKLVFDGGAFRVLDVREDGLLGQEVLEIPDDDVTDGTVEYAVTRLSQTNPASPVSGSFISVDMEVLPDAEPGTYTVGLEASLLDGDRERIRGVVVGGAEVVIS